MKITVKALGILCVVAGLLLAGCGAADDGAEGKPTKPVAGAKAEKPKKPKNPGEAKRKPGQPMPYFGDLPSLAAINVRNVVLEEITGKLKRPWAMEFLPDGNMLINEAGGKVKLLNLADRELKKIAGLPEIPYGKGQLGLMDLALHPEFESNQWVYFSHALRGQGEEELYATAVTRGRLVGEQLLDIEQLFVTEPMAEQLANFGGALEFDPQGRLYIGTGDRGRNYRAQEGSNLNGKIIRLEDDGSLPADNPYIGNPAVDDRIYAVGVRNPQGLIRDPLTDILYETEHGPMGGDEVNVIEGGKNYGWATISYGANYNTMRIGVGTAKPGLEQPLFYFLPSIATSPITIYRGEMFPEWDGDLFVGGLKGAHIAKLDLVDGAIKSSQAILAEAGGRIRDIKVAADGSLYILVQNGKLYRLYRDPNREGLEQPRERKGQVVYQTICSSCHSTGQAFIPQLDDPEAWTERLEQDTKALYRHTIDGYEGMPPRGLCEICTDQEIEQAVDFMVKEIRRKQGKRSKE